MKGKEEDMMNHSSPFQLTTDFAVSHRISLLSVVLLLAAAGLVLPFHIVAPVPAYASAGDPFILSWSSIQVDDSYSVAWGDYDSDGDLDLAVTGGSTKLYRNDDGDLTTDGVWSPFYGGRSIAWGDVDGDGDLDLLVGASTLRLYRNNNGTLTTWSVWSMPSGDTQSVAWGDYDGDGDLDFAVGNYGQNNTLYRNDTVQGSGSSTVDFTLTWSSTAISATTSVAWGDVDADGDLDLVVGNDNQANQLYRNDGVVGDVPQMTLAWSSTETDHTSSLAWGDVDDDGDLDLAVGNGGNHIYEPNRLYQNDSGMLTTSAVWFSGNDTTQNIAWGDYDGDGDLDLIAANSTSRANNLYRNDDGTLTTSPTWSSAEGEISHSIAWGDYDGDGDLDLAVGNVLSPNRLYRNTGGTLATTPSWSSDIDLDAWEDTQSIAWGDYDNDDDLDLMVGNGTFIYGSGYNNRLFRNNDGVLTTQSVYTSTESDFTNSVAWGDYDGDGDLDLATGNGYYTGTAPIGQPNRLYRNSGDSLTSNAIWASPGPDDVTESVAWGDYDGDGDLDLAVGNRGQPNRLYQNDTVQGLGTSTTDFTHVWSAAVAQSTHSVAWGDYDGDGDLDLAVGNDGQNQLYRNDGGVLATSPVWFSTESDSTTSVAWGDYDGDGDLDLAVGNMTAPARLYRNDHGMLTTSAVWSSVESYHTETVAWGDYDGDGDLDLAVGNLGHPNRMYRNDDGTLTTSAAWQANYWGPAVAWGDVDGDGDLDLAAGSSRNIGKPNRLYTNGRDGHLLPGAVPLVRVARPGPNADFYSTPRIWSDLTIPITYTLADPQGDPVKAIRAWFSPDGGGRWYTSTAASGVITTDLGTADYATWTCDNTTTTPIPDPGTVESTLPLASTDMIADVDVYLNIAHTWDWDLVITLTAPFNRSVLLVNRRGGSGDNFTNTVLDDEAATPIGDGSAPFTGRYRPEQALSRFDGYSPQGLWMLSVADVFGSDAGTLLSWGITVTLNSGAVHTYTWDTFASGFFGQSDNVVFRIEAVPAVVTGTRNAVPGPYLYGAYASQTYPFRVRGTQVRVLSGTVPVSGALVYRLPADQPLGGAVIADDAGTPFRTDNQGYLQGRGLLNKGDRLLALLPISATQSYTVYLTSASPSPLGMSAYTVTSGGVQTLTVSHLHPLILFNLDVSLEWDAHKDSAYLQQLQFNLHRASEYLYDFTNGQVALGRVNLFQNADEWAFSHVVILANNRLRPFAIQGGVVSTHTLDPHHNSPTDTIRYSPGQVTMGSVWNRYGNPGLSLGEDWPIILAHELSHYLLFHDDVYLGLDDSGNLIPVDTCLGSAMGDLYDRPDNTEFIADEGYWLTHCHNTLAAQSLGRYEWQTMQLWYPWLAPPALINPGPSTMPFDFTAIHLFEPYTPTDTLIDPTFYIDYQDGGSSSSEARAYLLHDDRFVVNLGSPFGGQNRVTARGAEPGDRLCVFDRPSAQFGCETIDTGDDRLALRSDPTWNPIIQLTPVDSTTLFINLTLPVSLSFPLRARIFPDLGYGEPPITLSPAGDTYSGTFSLSYPAMSGNIQVWVDEPATESYPRRETIIAYTIGGNPGAFRGAGGAFRGAGGAFRGAGGAFRGAGGAFRGAGAPIVSPDGQMIFFTDNPIDFITGTLFAIQGMAGLPPLPPGRTLVGQGYNLVASPGVTLPAGSVSVQYLSNDVLVAGANEADLALYFWNGLSWTTLDTTLDTYFNLASAPSHGQGVYALMASIKIPLHGPGWNLFAYAAQQTRPVTQALLSISGYYTTVYGYDTSDPSDPWKVYDVPAPKWVNDLHVLQFGRGYWINVSQSITLHLASGLSSLSADDAPPLPQNDMLLPPTTFYGAILDRNDFTPTPGITLTAWVLPDNVVCGQGLTREWDGQIVYVVDVSADGGPDSPTAGCGVPGRAVHFRMGGQAMFPTATWDNRRLWRVDLSPASSQAFLPLVLR